MGTTSSWDTQPWVSDRQNNASENHSTGTASVNRWSLTSRNEREKVSEGTKQTQSITCSNTCFPQNFILFVEIIHLGEWAIAVHGMYESP